MNQTPPQNLPLLARHRALKGEDNVSDAILLGRVGELADRLGEPEVETGLLKCLAADLPADWRSAVAREILLAQSWGLNVPESIWTAFDGSHPFEGGPRLGAFRGKRVATSAFPTDDSVGLPGSAPPWCLLWLTDRLDVGIDHSARIQEWTDAGIPFEQYSVFLITYPAAANGRPISQRSWTLAAHLAHRALSDADGCGIRRSLARDWIVTGDVRRDLSIEPVAIGNKCHIRCDRRWMFPPDNRPAVNRRVSLGYGNRLRTTRFPATVEAAWALLTNRGVVEGGTADWPQDLGVLHSFTSGAWQPVLASLLLAAPRRLVLWHSREDVSAKPAEFIERLLEPGFWTDSPPKVCVKPAFSEEKPNVELAEVQARIRATLESDLAGGNIVLFNVTQGNRMMAFAAHGLAQLHPNLWLMYRDVDAPPFEFTIIRYEGSLPTTEIIRPDGGARARTPACEIPDAAWQSLFSKSSPRPPDSAEKIREFLGGREVGEKVHFRQESALSRNGIAAIGP